MVSADAQTTPRYDDSQMAGGPSDTSSGVFLDSLMRPHSMRRGRICFAPGREVQQIQRKILTDCVNLMYSRNKTIAVTYGGKQHV